MSEINIFFYYGNVPFVNRKVVDNILDLERFSRKLLCLKSLSNSNFVGDAAQW
jgi:hypothetical protein